MTEMKCVKCDAVNDGEEKGWLSCECMGDYCPSHAPTNSCNGGCDCDCECCDYEDNCECSFPKFVIEDGIQSCSCCGLNDHYKNGVVEDWSDDEE